jgi:tRNA(Ile2) C34 agmatinyltransferase TiaS
MKGTATTKTNQGKKSGLDCCHRCGGLMVSELSTDTGTAEWHCVTCGDRVDQVILARRRHREVRQEAEQAFAGSGRFGLN